MSSTRKLSKVLVGGCFDILHYGHIYFLKRAKALGDYLVVLLESDQTVSKLKGDKRPIHTQEQRKESLKALKFVDEVINLKPLKSDKEYLDLVIKINPEIIAITKGDPLLEKKRSHAKKIGAKFVEIPKIKVSSTSTITKLLDLD